MKIFKSTDEPNAPNITQEEYLKIQEEVRKNPHQFKIEEIRKKEVTMDINQQKEPEISWKLPKEIKLDEEIENDFNKHGKESKQKQYIEELCEREFKIYYFSGEITEPKELQKQLFSFEDETIPKIENSQIATKTNDVTIDDVLKFWDNLGNNINKENLKQLKELLEKVDIDNNEKQQILEQAQKRYEQEMLKDKNCANNNININNNLTINNNQKILSMNNYSNMINFNNINQLSGAALSLLNSVKQFQPNLAQNNYLNQIQNLNNINNQNNLINQKYQDITQQQQNNQNLNTTINNNTINTIPMNNIVNMAFPGFDSNYTAFNQINNFQQVQLQNNNRVKTNIDQRMFMESAQRMNLSKYKTKPCRNYHSSIGCTRGENCFFIHDPYYKGHEIQNFDPRNYESHFPLQLPGFPQVMGIPNFNPQIGNQFQFMHLGMNPMNFGTNLQQMMGLTGNVNNMNKGEKNWDMKQYNSNDMINQSISKNNIENNDGVGVNGIGISNNGQVMGQRANLPGYDSNYRNGLQGQNMN